MGIRGLTSRVAVSSIGVGQFASRLAQICPVPQTVKRGRDGVRCKKIGLAISGGVDSMTLALLCSRVSEHLRHSSRDKDSFRYDFRAFIVDHAVRESSNSEAQSVAKVLRKIGIPAEILKLEWSTGDFHHGNFESVARHSRFQILGAACKRHEIDALFLAHHQDDQVETVLMRLSTGHKLLGLTGIKAQSEIPECYGLYGVHESGGLNTMGDTTSYCASSVGAINDGIALRHQLMIENGGVKIYRPLLAFSKEQLRRTCEESEMEWFEDHTNKDPTLTARNSIRHMYNTYTMPKALSKSSLISLCQTAQDRSAANLRIMNDWLGQCEISSFETRAGTVRVRFLDLSSVDLSTFTKSRIGMIATMLLRRIIMLITPNEHVELSTLINIASSIFPEYFATSDQIAGTTRKQTVAGLQFDPQGPVTCGGKHHWLISRQLPTKSIGVPPIEFAPQNAGAVNILQPWSQWCLYDGRYWLRLRHKYEESVVLTTFRQDHAAAFIKSLRPQDRSRLKLELKCLAPGGIRWTLPALVHKDRVVALPTLGFVSDLDKGSLEWEIRYKKVDLSDLPLIEGAF